MHTDLSPHLHTQECNKIIEALNKCHEENSLLRNGLFGVCDKLYHEMRACTKRERLDRTAKHIEDSRRKREENHKKFIEREKLNIDWREEMREKIRQAEKQK